MQLIVVDIDLLRKDVDQSDRQKDSRSESIRYTEDFRVLSAAC